MKYSITNRAWYQFKPENPLDLLRNYARVEPYQEGKTYEQEYTDENGYRWIPRLHIFRTPDEELSSTHNFVAKEELAYVAYQLDLTDEQLDGIKELCSCAYHRQPDNPPQCCLHCMGCLHCGPDFAAQ